MIELSYRNSEKHLTSVGCFFCCFLSGSMYNTSSRLTLGMEKETVKYLPSGRWQSVVAYGVCISALYINSKGVVDMEIPTHMQIAKQVRQFIREGKTEKFYQLKEWKDIRTEVLEENFYECQECLKKGIYARATCVHHVNELKDRPDLCLSKYYVDHKGVKHKQLVPLCNKCHNIVHDKLGSFVEGKRFTNTERW